MELSVGSPKYVQKRSRRFDGLVAEAALEHSQRRAFRIASYRLLSLKNEGEATATVRAISQPGDGGVLRSVRDESHESFLPSSGSPDNSNFMAHRPLDPATEGFDRPGSTLIINHRESRDCSASLEGFEHNSVGNASRPFVKLECRSVDQSLFRCSIGKESDVGSPFAAVARGIALLDDQRPCFVWRPILIKTGKTDNSNVGRRPRAARRGFSPSCLTGDPGNPCLHIRHFEGNPRPESSAQIGKSSAVSSMLSSFSTPSRLNGIQLVLYPSPTVPSNHRRHRSLTALSRRVS